MSIEPIESERDYRRALEEIESLMTARQNTPEGDRLDVLVTLVRLGKPRTIPSISPNCWLSEKTRSYP